MSAFLRHVGAFSRAMAALRSPDATRPSRSARLGDSSGAPWVYADLDDAGSSVGLLSGSTVKPALPGKLFERLLEEVSLLRVGARSSPFCSNRISRLSFQRVAVMFTFAHSAHSAGKSAPGPMGNAAAYGWQLSERDIPRVSVFAFPGIRLILTHTAN